MYIGGSLDWYLIFTLFAMIYSMFMVTIFLLPMLLVYFILTREFDYKLFGPISNRAAVMLMFILCFTWCVFFMYFAFEKPKISSASRIRYYLSEYYFSGKYLGYIGFRFKHYAVRFLIEPFNWLVGPSLSIWFGLRWRRRKNRVLSHP